MKKIAFAACLVLLAPTGLSAQQAEPADAADSPLINPRQVQASKNRLIRLTDSGIDPAEIQVTNDDGIMFFLNDTTDALLTLEIVFGSQAIHCATPNMTDAGKGILKSTRPFGPKDFASTCFPEKGVYPFTVYGLPKHPEGLLGTVRVD